jgi:hypothetical protein
MSAGAAAAAAAAARRRREEEEEMTHYSARDLNEDWEFKIIRSATRTFRDPEKLRAILEEEAKAGWVLVEKFDDQRVRLKRPASFKNADAKLDVDPYRTSVGTSEATLIITIVGSIIGLFVLMGVVAWAIAR